MKPLLTNTVTSKELEFFEQRNSDEGRFLRYASSRTRNFLNRQILTLAGSVGLGLFVSFKIGLITALIALIGEGIDCLYLSTVKQKKQRGQPFEVLRIRSGLTATLQALTIALCAIIAWCSADTTETHFYAIVFLFGASLNAGLVLPYHRLAAISRLTIYGMTLAGLFLLGWLQLPHHKPLLLFNLFGACVLFYTAKVYLNYVTGGYYRETKNKREVLHSKLKTEETALQLAEQSRRAARLAHVAKRANDSVMITDINGRIEYVNDTFVKLTGYSEEEALGQHPWKLLNGPDTNPKTIATLQKELSNNRPVRTEILNYRKDGSTLWVETSISPILNDAGEPELTIAIERDISQTKRRETELAKAKLAAENGERAKSNFLAMMSHELRTPMNGIIGMADMLRTTDLDTEQEGYARTIQTSSESLLTVLNDILDLTTLERGQFEKKQESFDIINVVNQTVELFQTEAQKKCIELSVADMKLPEKVSGDTARIRQLLMILVSNAVKFTNQGTVVVSAEQTSLNDITFSVADSGPGISLELQKRLFHPFVTGDPTVTRSQDGTGLGLAICKKITEFLGGEISLTSTVGSGSTFVVRLPLAQAKTLKSTAPRPISPNICSLPEGTRILVAEDNRTNRLLLSKMLLKCEVVLEFAENGEIAVEKWRAMMPDLVLMDLSMPVMGGIQATELIRSEEHKTNTAETLIVALTANAFDSDRQACMDAGMNGFLTKPVKRAELLSEITRQLSQRPSGTVTAG
ncbi:MAG: ATP-binding protein [Pseudoruegeria sp.]